MKINFNFRSFTKCFKFIEQKIGQQFPFMNLGSINNKNNSNALNTVVCIDLKMN